MRHASVLVVISNAGHERWWCSPKISLDAASIKSLHQEAIVQVRAIIEGADRNRCHMIE
jgi:hypothetical protein